MRSVEDDLEETGVETSQRMGESTSIDEKDESGVNGNSLKEPFISGNNSNSTLFLKTFLKPANSSRRDAMESFRYELVDVE